MEYKEIIYEPGPVTKIIMNRPRYYNAQSWRLREEMDDAFNRAVDDEKVGAIVLSGNGKHFSVGHDIGTKEDKAYRNEQGHDGTDRMSHYRQQRAINVENTLRWRNLPKPTIAMIQGYCIFGGWMIASAMDILFAHEDALFLPTHFQYFCVPWDIGPRRAKEIIFEHRFMTAWEAFEHGFINRVLSTEKLEEETIAYAERVAKNYLDQPFRVRMAKFSINHMMDAMGFSAEIETAFHSYSLMRGLTPGELPSPETGGLAKTDVALKNLEINKPWLDAMFKRNEPAE